MLLTQKLLAWLIIGNAPPFALPLSGGTFDELSVKIGQATWTPPDAGAKVPYLDRDSNPAIRLTNCNRWIKVRILEPASPSIAPGASPLPSPARGAVESTTKHYRGFGMGAECTSAESPKARGCVPRASVRQVCCLGVFAWRAGPRLQARGRIAIRIRNECIATFPSMEAVEAKVRRRHGPLSQILLRERLCSLFVRSSMGLGKIFRTTGAATAKSRPSVIISIAKPPIVAKYAVGFVVHGEGWHGSARSICY